MNYADIQKQLDWLQKEAPWKFISNSYKGKGRPKKTDYISGRGMQNKMDALAFDLLQGGFMYEI